MEVITILIIVGVILLLPTAYAAKIGAPYAPTFSAAIKNGLDYLQLDKNDVLIDLGAGDGKILLAAQERDAKAIGYELSPIMWFITWLRLVFTKGRLRGVKSAHIYLRNFYKQSLSPETTVIFAFLMPENMTKVRQYLAQQKLPNLRAIMIYAFPFKDIQPIKTIHTPKCARVFIYDPKDIQLP